MKKTTVAFRTLGCKLNQCESAQMQESLSAAGYSLVDWEQSADIRVVNTCTVTGKSDSTCRREIRLAKRRDPACVLVVTGCYAQVAPEAVAAIPGVDLVLGNLEKSSLLEHLASFARKDEKADLPALPRVAVTAYQDNAAFEHDFLSHFYGYTRAFLKIQNGCNSHCAYCIIPVARGPARSMPRAQVVEQVRILARRGFKEIVLTGINLGSWGRGTGEGSLATLLATLLTDSEIAWHPQLPALAEPSVLHRRLRLSSIEPLEVAAGLLDVVEQARGRIAPHFHLPLQSGSPAVLRRMGRPYSPQQYQDIVEEIAERFPTAAIGADVIVGFPGETDKEFAETLAFVEQSPLTYLHVFSYSDRPGTLASAMSAKVDPAVIHERSVHLRRLGQHKVKRFRARLVGLEEQALVLRDRASDGRLIAITGNYMEVLVRGGSELINSFARVRLEQLRADGRWEATILALEENQTKS